MTGTESDSQISNSKQGLELVGNARLSEFGAAVLRIGRASFLPIAFLVLLVCVWEFLVRLLNVPTYLVPAPTVVWSATANSISLLLANTWITVTEALMGFMIGGLVGFLVGVVFAQIGLFEKAMYPYFIGMQAVPIVALAPLLVIWFGSGLTGKVVLAAFICIFPVVVNTVIGLKRVDREALEMMHVLSASRLQILFRLRIPTALPYLFSGLRVASTLSVTGAIVAEIAGARAGLGHCIIVSSYRTDTPLMFGAIILAAIVGILFFGFVCVLEKMLIWHVHSNVETPTGQSTKP